MKTNRFLLPLLAAAIAILAASCEDKLVPDAPVVVPGEPEEPVAEARDSVWIKDCPEGFLLGTETHIYAAFNKDVPKDYRATLRSSDESVLRVSPGASGWDFYVTAAKLGEASLTLSFNGVESVYTVSAFEKVVPTVSVDEDFMMRLRFVASDSEGAYSVVGPLSMQMQGTASVVCAYMDDRNNGNSHETVYDRQSVSLGFLCEDIPLGESIVIKDLTPLKELLDSYIWSNSFEEDGKYEAGGFYYEYKDYYSLDRLDIGYDLRDEKGQSLRLTVDMDSLKERGWWEENVSIEYTGR